MSPSQLLVWLLIVFLFPCLLLLVLPIFFPYSLMALIVLYTICMSQTVFLTLMDPSPESVQAKRRTGYRPPEWDENQGSKETIKDGYCTLCEVQVPENTKHCRRCNKCIEEFDHHCIWLDNCIGGKNYRFFIWMISTLAVSLSAMVAFLAYLFYLALSKSSHLPVQNGVVDARLIDIALPAWSALCGSILVVLFLSDILIIQLILFHLRLCVKGITTYAFLKELRGHNTQVVRSAGESGNTQSSLSHHRPSPPPLEPPVLPLSISDTLETPYYHSELPLSSPSPRAYQHTKLPLNKLKASSNAYTQRGTSPSSPKSTPFAQHKPVLPPFASKTPSLIHQQSLPLARTPSYAYQLPVMPASTSRISPSLNAIPAWKEYI